MPIKKIMRNCNLVPYSSEYFEPVRDGDFTAKGFAIFIKRQSLIWVDSRLRENKKGWFGGKLYLGGQKEITVRNEKFG